MPLRTYHCLRRRRHRDGVHQVFERPTTTSLPTVYMQKAADSGFGLGTSSSASGGSTCQPGHGGV